MLFTPNQTTDTFYKTMSSSAWQSPSEIDHETFN